MESSLAPVKSFRLTIILAILAIAMGWFGSNQLGDYTMLIVCSALLLFGLPHGAFDIVLIRNVFKKHLILYVLLFYLLIALLSCVIWLVYPTLFLVVFILISIYHFGDSDWPDDQKLLKIAWGTMVIGAPTLFHKQEAIELFSWLISNNDARAITLALSWVVIPATGLFILKARKNPTQLFYLALLIPIYYLSHPLLSFTFYFTIFHARRHLDYWHQRLSSEKESKLISWITSIITILVIGYGVLEASSSMMNQSLFVATIITLACLTVPHMMMIYYAHRRTHRYLSNE